MIILTNNLNSDYHIVTNTNASECERFAATELAKYLYKSTLCSIPYFSDKCKKRGKEILIGKIQDMIIMNKSKMHMIKFIMI